MDTNNNTTENAMTASATALKYRIENSRTGANLGSYYGDCPEAAIAAMYCDAGYPCEVVDGVITFSDNAPSDGVKSEITATEIKDFDAAMTAFVDHCQSLQSAPHPSLECPKIEVMKGRKYARLVCDDGSSRSAFCFVDLQTGDVLMAASWKAPAKHTRGSIFTPDSYGVTQHGAEYICR